MVWCVFRAFIYKLCTNLKKLSSKNRLIKIKKLKKIIILILTITGLFSCNQSNKSKSNTVAIETVNSEKNVQSDKDIYSKHEYTDSYGKNIIIENGYPRGGVKYIDLDGKECSYAVFWTRINNETDNPLELNIDLPINSYKISNFPGKYFKVLIPTDTLTLDKIPLINQTTLKSFLDNNIYKSSSFKRTINPKKSNGFYFVMLISTLEATGMTRTELNLKEQKLFYKISRYSMTKPAKIIDEKEINCGSINLENLTLKK